MFDRLGKDATGRHAGGSRARSKGGMRLRVEPLEGRALLASLAPIPSVTVEAGDGYQVPLNGTYAGNTDPQTYTVTTDGATGGVTGSVASGEFWTVGISHASSGSGDPAFSGTLTFQLYQDLTPNSVAKIESLINGTVPYSDLTSAAASVIYPNGQGTTGVDYYTASNGGDFFGRVQLGFPDTDTGIVQGGALVAPISGQVFATGYANETSSQLVFNGTGQLALANSGGTSSQDSQFFVTTGSPRSLDGNYTIFGQLVSGASILQEMTQVTGTAISSSESLGNTPTDPIKITSSTLSTTNPNGVIHINGASSTANAVTNVTVTATDTVNNTQTSQTFPVITIPSATGSEPTSTAPMITPIATPIDTPAGTPVSFQISSTEPTGTSTGYTYVADGGLTAGSSSVIPSFNTTVSNGTATVSSTGLVTVTPTAGYTGPINVLVGVSDGTNRAGTASTATSPANYSLQNVTVNVGSFSTAPTIKTVTTPIAASVSQTVQIQLSATNPSGGQLSYIVEGAESDGAFTAVTNATAGVDGNGLLSVIPTAGYTGPIDLLVGVRDQTDRSGTSNLNDPTNFSTESIVINVAPQTSTGAVRFIQDSSSAATGAFIVTPLPQTTKNASNTIDITTDPAGNIEAIVNGVTDLNQPALNDVTSIIVYGSTANDRITVDPAITVPVFLSGGTGGKNVLVAGGGPTREQGWYGTSNVEKQGESNNYLFGKAGKVTFVKGSGTNNVTFAGTESKVRKDARIKIYPAIPKGTFYKFSDGKLVETKNPFPKTTITKGSTSNS